MADSDRGLAAAKKRKIKVRPTYIGRKPASHSTETFAEKKWLISTIGEIRRTGLELETVPIFVEQADGLVVQRLFLGLQLQPTNGPSINVIKLTGAFPSRYEIPELQKKSLER
jgi:hypothetical protein